MLDQMPDEEAIFNVARGIDSRDAREAYLEQVCGDDAAVRSRVKALLRVHEEDASFLKSPPVQLTGPLDGPPSENPGTIVGPYKLLEQIGEGGFGVVFMAEQHQPVRRKVALKVLKPGMDTRQVIARFEAERQALAIMDHPNIAKVLDGGATESGRPYFVMELVRGVPITDFCDQNHLPVTGRLALFMSVCKAVQHAHQKGIIHRDLKPSNIMVTLHDETPVAKVIDFGIAKATGQQLTEKTLFTNFAQLVGTPMYMSPEQAQMSGLDIDTRSDIYALGVLLYELLTGATPFDQERLRTVAYDELRRIIREEEPPRPSTRMSTPGAACATLSASRQSDPKRLSQLFRGELDWIVMKALEKDRNRRYDSAGAFAADIERFLRDEPVQACPPSTWYRLRKLARRRKGPVLAASLVVVALVAGIVGTTWGMLRANREATQKQNALNDRDTALTAVRLSERDGKEELFSALINQSRAERRSGRVGQRFVSWQAMTEAAAIAKELQIGEGQRLALRNEAIACLALVDLRLEKELEGRPKNATVPVFDADLRHYACSTGHGEIAIRGTGDGLELARLNGPGDMAEEMQFSSDGVHLAVRHATRKPIDGPNCRVWNWTRQATVFETSIESGSQVEFSPDGRRLAIGHSDGMVAVHDLATGDVMNRFHSPSPRALAFDPGGSRLAASGAGGLVRVCELKTGEVVLEITCPGNVMDLAWHPTADLIAVACHPSEVYLLNVADGSQRATLSGHQATAVFVGFSPDGDLVLSSSWDGTTRIWDTWTGRQLIRVSGRASRFSRDGRYMATYAEAATTLRLWEVRAGRAYRPLKPAPAAGGEALRDGSISVDGRWFIAGNSAGAQIWDLALGTHVGTIPLQGESRSAFAANGDLFTSGAAGVAKWPVRIQDGSLAIGPPRQLTPMQASKRISVDRRGRILAAAGGNWIIDLEDPAERLIRFDHVNANDAAVSPDGRLVATGTWNGFGVRIWDPTSGELVRELPPEVGVSSVGFSPDSRVLVVGTQSEFNLWDTETWAPVRRIEREWSDDNLGMVAYSADGTMLALTMGRDRVHLVDPATGRTLAAIQGPYDQMIGRLCFAPDGARLAVVIDTRPAVVRVWELRSIREELGKLGLDWESPPLPPEGPLPDPVRLEVDYGTPLPDG